MEIIFKRRSVRSFLEKDIEEEKICKLLKAAMRAPSAGNQQPWEFIVIKERKKMLKITEFHPYAGSLKEAGCCIVICGNTERQKYEDDYWVQDCSAATQNLLLEAEYLGLGAVWLGVYPMAERMKPLQVVLGLPEQVIPLCAVSIGYPKSHPEPMDTFLEERIHKEQW